MFAVILYTEGGISVEALTTTKMGAEQACERVFAEYGKNPGFYSVEVSEAPAIDAGLGDKRLTLDEWVKVASEALKALEAGAMTMSGDDAATHLSALAIAQRKIAIRFGFGWVVK